MSAPMSEVPRRIESTEQPCPQCGTSLLVTRDAIGRPRLRCPECQGVVRTPMEAGTVGPQHKQSAMSSRDLAWALPAALPGVTRRQPKGAPLAAQDLARVCADCGALMPYGGRGRPRVRCADRLGCATRAGGRA